MATKVSFLSSSNIDSDFKSKVLHTKVKHTDFLVQHNIPFAVANHLALLSLELFRHSEIAKNFKCSRTRATYILNQAMRLLLRNELTEYVKKETFLVND